VSDPPVATAEPDESGAAPVSRSEKRFEIVATVLLAFSALATAWSGYQASLWDGIQSSDYTQASAARTRAAQKLTEANQYRLADLSVLENYVDASFEGDAELAAYYRARFSDELELAFVSWQALDPDDPDTPTGPFHLPEYQLPVEVEAQAKADEAHQTFLDGEAANDHSDTYVATTLFFAAVLFFAAISERFAFAPARATLLGLAAVGLVAGMAVMLTQPVTSG
jgi:hypothetical protein